MKKNISMIRQFIIGAGSIFDLSGNYFNIKYKRRFYPKLNTPSYKDDNKAFLQDNKQIRQDFAKIKNKLPSNYSKVY